MNKTINLIKMFDGVNKNWRSLLLNSDLKMDTMLADVIKDLEGENITPPADQILEFARLTTLDNVKCVVIGQDPYHTPGTAHGLSFSSKDEKTPASLRKIYAAIVKSSLLPAAPKSNDLSNWARQGFLMMNSAWTTSVGTANKHQKIWTKYTDTVIRALNLILPAGTMWLLWGKDAKEKGALIDGKKHRVLEYCHPVAYPPNDFTDCPHFTEVAKRYPEFTWSLAPVETHWFTDGACPNNQSATKARAAWGVICVKGPLAGKSFGDAVLLKKITKLGAEIDARPTNIRAEGLALINAMEMILKAGLYGKHVIYSDSKFWIDDMYTKHIPNWLSDGLSWDKHANSDLTEKFWSLTQQLKSKLGIFEFVFVNAWHDWSPTTDAEKYVWEGNKAAEEAAEKYLPQVPQETEAKDAKDNKSYKFTKKK